MRDNLNQYLHNTDRYPQITPPEELSLATTIQAMVVISGYPTEVDYRKLERDRYTPEQNHTIDLGIAAYQKLTTANLLLVVKFAKRFRNRGLDFESLIQHGNMGLMRAAEKFDPARKHRFSTYAYWWINQAMQRAVTNYSRAIRLPINISDNLDKVERERQKYYVQEGRYPDFDTLSKICKIQPSELRHTLDSDRAIISLNRFIDDRHTLEDVVADDTEDEAPLTPEQIAVRDLLSEVPDEMRLVVCMHYGVYDREHTLSEIMTAVGVSKTRCLGLIAEFGTLIKKRIQPEN